MNSTPNYGFQSPLDTVDQTIKRVEDKADKALAFEADIIRTQKDIECLAGRICNSCGRCKCDCYPRKKLEERLAQKVDKADLEAHKVNPYAHEELFRQKVDKEEGYGLISGDDLAQIRKNKENISGLADSTYTQDEVDVLLDQKANKSDFQSFMEDLQAEVSQKAPIRHSNETTKYGQGTDALYGHVKLSNATNSTSGVGDGVAATPVAVKAAYDLAAGKQPAGNYVMAEAGKGLSTNDYTMAEKNLVATISSKANISDVYDKGETNQMLAKKLDNWNITSVPLNSELGGNFAVGYSGNTVILEFNVYGDGLSTGLLITTLPSAVRPSSKKYLSCTLSIGQDGNWGISNAIVSVDTNGQVRLKETNGSVGYTRVVGTGIWFK